VGLHYFATTRPAAHTNVPVSYMRIVQPQKVRACA
jgi:hypothetical protein